MSAIETTVWRNLSTRSGDGATVTLDYSRTDSGDVVRVVYKSPTSDFILYPGNENALDAFNHPFVYLNRVLQRGTYADHSDAEKQRIAQTL